MVFSWTGTGDVLSEIEILKALRSYSETKKHEKVSGLQPPFRGLTKEWSFIFFSSNMFKSTLGWKQQASENPSVEA